MGKEYQTTLKKSTGDFSFFSFFCFYSMGKLRKPIRATRAGPQSFREFRRGA
jgi:hypothetical protein